MFSLKKCHSTPLVDSFKTSSNFKTQLDEINENSSVKGTPKHKKSISKKESLSSLNLSPLNPSTGMKQTRLDTFLFSKKKCEFTALATNGDEADTAEATITEVSFLEPTVPSANNYNNNNTNVDCSISSTKVEASQIEDSTYLDASNNLDITNKQELEDDRPGEKNQLLKGDVSTEEYDSSDSSESEETTQKEEFDSSSVHVNKNENKNADLEKVVSEAQVKEIQLKGESKEPIVKPVVVNKATEAFPAQSVPVPPTEMHTLQTQMPVQSAPVNNFSSIQPTVNYSNYYPPQQQPVNYNNGYNSPQFSYQQPLPNPAVAKLQTQATPVYSPYYNSSGSNSPSYNMAPTPPLNQAISSPQTANGYYTGSFQSQPQAQVSNGVYPNNYYQQYPQYQYAQGNYIIFNFSII